MDQTTIVAVALLVVFGVIAVTAITRDGVDGATKLWCIAGPLTGAILGSITTYYFSDKSHQKEIAVVNKEKAEVVAKVETVKKQIDETLLTPFSLPPIDVAAVSRQTYQGHSNLLKTSAEEKLKFIEQIKNASSALNQITIDENTVSANEKSRAGADK
jgi:hypothetical protein